MAFIVTDLPLDTLVIGIDPGERTRSLFPTSQP
jgi:hypothetical protein